MVLLLAALASACTGLSLTIANLPARFAQVRRSANIAFGPDARDRLDIYCPTPATPASAPGVTPALPVIIFWHGGGWVDGNKDEYRFVGAALAQLGYLVVLPNYRVYPAVRFPSFLDDAARAVAWTEQQIADYGGDPHRIVLMGHSAGAHMAAMLALNHSYLLRAGADPHDIVGLIGLSGPYRLRPNTPVLNTIFSSPYTPHDWQVLPYASGDAPPSLLIHGAADDLVWASNTLDLGAALSAHGVRVESRIYAGKGHADTVAALSVPARRRAPTLQDIATFMQTLERTTDARPERQAGLEAAALEVAP
jgi:acetyl esterase/lipase